MPHSPSKRKSKIAFRRKQIADLYSKGIRSSSEIAKIVGCTSAAVNKDLRTLREEWAKSAHQTYSEATTALLAELQLRKREAWAYFQRSQRPKKEGDKPGDGDPRALAILGEIAQQEMKLLGLPRAEAGDGHGSRVTISMIPANLLAQMNNAIGISMEISDTPASPPYATQEIGYDGKEATDATQPVLDNEPSEKVPGGCAEGSSEAGDDGESGDGESQGGGDEEEAGGEGGFGVTEIVGTDGDDSIESGGEEDSPGSEEQV